MASRGCDGEERVYSTVAGVRNDFFLGLSRWGTASAEDGRLSEHRSDSQLGRRGERAPPLFYIIQLVLDMPTLVFSLFFLLHFSSWSTLLEQHPSLFPRRSTMPISLAEATARFGHLTPRNVSPMPTRPFDNADVLSMLEVSRGVSGSLGSFAEPRRGKSSSLFSQFFEALEL